MSIIRHDPTSILSLAVVHGDTVYLAGVVAKNLDNDIKGQAREILAEIEAKLADPRSLVEIMVVAAK